MLNAEKQGSDALRRPMVIKGLFIMFIFFLVLSFSAYSETRLQNRNKISSEECKNPYPNCIF